MMRNQHYGDLSNLNAPYDAFPLQGFGLGQADDPKYPWRDFSSNTQALQEDLNLFLFNDGACEIDVDGKLGSKTCGALRYAQEKGVIGADGIPSTCIAHASEGAQPRPKSPCPAGTPAPIQTPGPDGEGEDLIKTGGGIPGWAIGLGIGLVAVAAAMALRGKKRKR